MPDSLIIQGDARQISLAEWQKGYIAAMIDAECHVGIQREFQKKGKTPRYTLRFELAMTDKKPVEFLNTLISRSKIISMNGKDRRLPYYRLRIINQECLALLRMVRPYIQGKGRQIDLICELEELRLSFSPSRRHFGKTHFQSMPQEFVTAADRIFTEFRSLQLNKKPRGGDANAGVDSNSW